ncbi:low molecular weight protein-tyrosine-phosphatase [Enterovibrio paralichthyis]|uniref:low molecular weight protein-tyrosine-phosphatase n=1 Tax=Enterovibrio paralichthyis TaxID=2853805 RepID=UPI001C44D5FB|nr:low molecular weight protein-tyrosine-phosphatase [Enterovibrio paralichthyis]MBV7299593.1 low molecular weight phosphotyrosine protein phosphatase [Enterovibrio paralichthyis]
MFNRVLVVCTGNICRSPIAEVLMKELLPKLTVESAGIAVTKSHLTDAPAHPHSQQVCTENNLDISAHTARQLTPELCDSFDLILVMSHAHIEEVAMLSPGSRHKTMLFGQWIGLGDIEDPILEPKASFDTLYKTLVRATNAWAKKLS